MTVPSLNSEFKKYWSLLTLLQKQSLLNLVKSFVQKDGEPSMEQYDKEIDEAMLRIDAGEFISHEDLEKEAEQW
jgi:hypothetical protein